MTRSTSDTNRKINEKEIKEASGKGACWPLIKRRSLLHSTITKICCVGLSTIWDIVYDIVWDMVQESVIQIPQKRSRAEST